MQPHNPETPELSSQSLSPFKSYIWAKSASWLLASRPSRTACTKLMVNVVTGSFASVCIKFLEEVWYTYLWEAIWSGSTCHRAADLYSCPHSTTHYSYNLGENHLICLCCNYTVCWIGGRAVRRGRNATMYQPHKTGLGMKQDVNGEHTFHKYKSIGRASREQF